MAVELTIAYQASVLGALTFGTGVGIINQVSKMKRWWWLNMGGCSHHYVPLSKDLPVTHQYALLGLLHDEAKKQKLPNSQRFVVPSREPGRPEKAVVLSIPTQPFKITRKDKEAQMDRDIHIRPIFTASYHIVAIEFWSYGACGMRYNWKEQIYAKHQHVEAVVDEVIEDFVVGHHLPRQVAKAASKRAGPLSVN